jgi:hypothetical protein
MICNADPDDHITVVVAAAMTYRLDDSAKIRVTETRHPIRITTDGSEVPDVMFLKEGISVCVAGFVYPRSRGDSEARAALLVGERAIPLIAYGPRVWRKNAFGRLVPGEPRPMEPVEMSWRNAFGGKAPAPARVVELDGEEAFLPAHESGDPNNFEGVGFYLSEEQALGSPLPQLEDPGNVLRDWNDRPEPICFASYPPWGGLRSKHVVRDGNLDMTGLKRITNRSAPSTTFMALAPGTPIVLTGMRPSGGVLRFNVPEHPLQVRMETSSQHELKEMSLDAVDVNAETCEVRLLYRSTLRCALIQFEERRVLVEPTADFPDQ